MIVSRAPFRISLAGGGTDYQAWFRENGGAVLAATIQRYCYVTCRPLPPFYRHKSRIVWSEIELVEDHDTIRHPVIRAALRTLGIEDGIEMHHLSDVPAYSGLGSSSAFVVAVLNALTHLKDRGLDKPDLAREAIRFEQTVLNEICGVQDPIQIAHGGINRIDIGRDGRFQVTPLAIPEDSLARLEDGLMLVFLRRQRVSTPFAQATIDSIPTHGRHLARLMELVGEGAAILTDGADLRALGAVLHEGWRIKRQLAETISAPEIDEVYERARTAGAHGGKLLGAGGGGFLLICAEPDRRRAVEAALDGFPCLTVRFERHGAAVFRAEDPHPD